ncbi:neurogenic locus notch-like protein 2-like [Micractinium conductrix]|uniref:Neurogenic locus notch-like protein 2-like n=1 Tax=Micractinium conductrix TaxID=554055 RepID=A0A2P6V685_9CHLO|nr:neurogenic locus notch-like protein 2-like [Micractinium conductrix]|eukprot:PSC69599.1 neurogenic locus notch-like protein 2-like [Micractinium conductrix]
MGDPAYGCVAGLSCDEVWKRCYPQPRKRDQPCKATPTCAAYQTAPHCSNCAAGLVCNDYTRRCQEPPSKARRTCHDSLPCVWNATDPAATQLSCERIRNECFPKPRVDDTPCVTSSECGTGLTCEVGISMNECYDAPRKMGQPCNAGNACASDLACDPVTYRCVGPAGLKEPCGGVQTCKAGLSCHPGLQRCLPAPRQEGQHCAKEPGLDCAATAPTGEPLSCDYLNTARCVKYQTHATTSNVAGAHCYPGRPCIDGLTCSTSDLKCYNNPRTVGEPCVPANPPERCGPGLICRDDTHRCAPAPIMGEMCYPGFACSAPAYACAGDFRVCARAADARLAGEPCATGADCGGSAGLVCDATRYPYCAAGSASARRVK